MEEKRELIWRWNPRLQNGGKDCFEKYDLGGNLQSPRPMGPKIIHEWKGCLFGVKETQKVKEYWVARICADGSPGASETCEVCREPRSSEIATIEGRPRCRAREGSG